MKFSQRMSQNFYPYLKDYVDKPFSYLEIGVFKGDTVRWVLKNIATHVDSKIYGIDPFEFKLFTEHDVRTLYEWNLILERLKYIEKISNGRVKYIKGYSQEVLRSDVFFESQFDVIYIDGDHAAASVMQDFSYSWPFLKVGGIMILDDYNQPQVKSSVDLCVHHLQNHCEILYSNRQFGLRRIS